MVKSQEAKESEKKTHAYEPVCVCVDPTIELSELLTDEIAREDKRLMRERLSSADQQGPQWSTYLCHLQYALSSCVMAHQKEAAHSNKVRGAALSQLMKVLNLRNRVIPNRGVSIPEIKNQSNLTLTDPEHSQPANRGAGPVRPQRHC